MNSRMMKRGFKRAGIYLAAIVVLLWTLLPILWMFISSITPTADLLTIDDFGLGTLTAQEQSLVYEIIKSRADNLSTIIVSQRPCADWYEWLGGKYIADGVADRIINFYYLIELKGESRRALARKQAKEAAEL